MVNRILLGDHPAYGMGGFVSTPGVDVFSANKFQFSWSTIYEQFQILQSGSLIVTRSSGSGPWVGLTWSNLGYLPIIFFSNDKYRLQFQYLSGSSGQVRAFGVGSNSEGVNDEPTGDSAVYYIVTRSIKP